ncbi:MULTISPECIES: hypothetical protein [Rhodanobacter]|uniref:Uncharacterized protein n=1 Tax=Rhodanobacter denitrificans TaxID=666685 RepID=I4WS71_9GAMM|nr:MULTISPECIES: hypothetical protein [Rhodanobacter]AGG89392.1 hypothetical protein R2APBS1_2296 [Rhodanobacter denitrificans]EIM02313.1 hypothetical protein UUC_09618 [Rhodanobacter denitrificans]KZC20261.1 hypothetical protein RHOFW104R3_26695 [Rhodanobacter denitrificans]UJJ49595.1 hypothetical protein LRK52_10135 [Rhodanobacter denitrificans]UJJ58207.1 hypothetical protein LRK55_16310 [Rhodanobacter denitrificans]
MFRFFVRRSLRRSLTGPDAAGAVLAPGRKLFVAPAGESVLAQEQRVDDELAQSFPASDPPSWVQGTVSAQH